MKISTITWNVKEDNTKIRFSEDFLNSDRIVKLDVLKDLTIMFDQIYEELLLQQDQQTSFINKFYKRFNQ